MASNLTKFLLLIILLIPVMPNVKNVYNTEASLIYSDTSANEDNPFRNHIR